MAKIKTHWQKFQELHALIVRAGAICEQIHLHPKSLQKLSDEMFAHVRRGKTRRTKDVLVGAITSAGPVKIVSDKEGVQL